MKVGEGDKSRVGAGEMERVRGKARLGAGEEERSTVGYWGVLGRATTGVFFYA